MQRTINIEDTLPDRLETVIGEVKEELLRYLEESEPDTLPDLHGDLDYSGGFHEIVDSSVPIYTNEIRDTWYLHGGELEEAYENAGVGNNPRENDGMSAIYFWLSEKASEWYHENARGIFEEWQAKHRAAKLKNVEIFYVSAEDFENAEPGTWQALLTRASQGLPGYYWWTCAPGCLPDSEAVGPFETREEAEEDVINN